MQIGDDGYASFVGDLFGERIVIRRIKENGVYAEFFNLVNQRRYLLRGGRGVAAETWND